MGWCGAVGDLDMLSVGRLGRLRDLQISYTRVRVLAHMMGLLA